MKLLGIDYGSKRVGLALGEDTENLAVPYGAIENKGDDFVIGEIKKICKDESVDKIILGLPLHTELREEMEIIKKFADYLKKNIGLTVELVDEKFTTKIALQDERYKDLYKDRAKGWKDAVAAEKILRGYLDKLI